jgi:hypothetical protein
MYWEWIGERGDKDLIAVDGVRVGGVRSRLSLRGESYYTGFVRTESIVARGNVRFGPGAYTLVRIGDADEMSTVMHTVTRACHG